MDKQDKVSALKGVGPKKEAALKKLGILTIEDLIHIFPRDYQDRRGIQEIACLTPDRAALIRGRIDRIKADPYRRGRKQIMRLHISDDSAEMEVVFFNAAYLAKSFRQGSLYDFFGKPVQSQGKLQMVHPDYAPSEKGLEQGILPIYPLTAGISQKEMRTWQRTALSALPPSQEFLPSSLIERNRLCTMEYAVRMSTFPGRKTLF